MTRFGCAVLLCFAANTAHAETPSEGNLFLKTDSAVHSFKIEIADEPGERSRGLMYRESLDEDAGMLFIYPTPRIASFWTKNTLIPLDMLFIDRSGTIVTIAAETTPHSLSPVVSDAPVIAVLEIDGGDAARLGIDVGDTVKWIESPTAK